MARSGPPNAELEIELPEARILRLEFDDLEDASLSALQRRPDLMLDPNWRRQTSYFEKLELRFPDELEGGLAKLRAHLDAGQNLDARVAAARAERGDAAVLAWSKR